ncbi:hypothetical protein [Paenibacillus nasutitermitis]|uniref:Ribosomal protein L7/L12 C-terminal domain-containing protein n=1 Tax=Paenibacillus nasutitermitis TaxID=1652958 RepID=A0A917E029_9BACL|nr:hypothetical protein [Paenibacillus nasutitermitis]GGD83301.1 hypothetical protein GCM10010911_46840 [Paenibacillus nasutitermitis]
MDTTQMVAVIALVLSLLLLIRVISLQGQLNILRADLERLESRPEAAGLSITSASASMPAAAPQKIQHPDRNMELDNRLRILLEEGKRIQAIKLFRIERKVSLKEAKDYVDELEELR